MSFRRSSGAGHLQCQNDHYDYMHRNGGMRNNTEWASSNHLPFVVGNVAPARSTFECKVCRSPPVCIVWCHARILYVHSTSSEMSRACIHLGMHDHHISNGICRESLDMAYLVGSSLEVVMNKYNTFATPNCGNFVYGSKRFVRSEMGTLDSIMALNLDAHPNNTNDGSQKQMGKRWTHERLLCGWCHCHSISKLWSNNQHCLRRRYHILHHNW